MLQMCSFIRQMGLILLITLQLSAFSQSNYTFTTSTTPYAPITGTAINVSPISTPINIGFNFNFNGVDYSQVIASKFGWLSFNTSINATMAESWREGNLTNTPLRPLIGALYYDNGISWKSQATQRYSTTGTAPNRVFTFEWYYSTFHWYTNNDICFQVKLYETSNKIEMHYLTVEEYFHQYDLQASIGLAFNNIGDYLAVSSFDANAIASTEFEGHHFPGMPNDNQKYTFTPITAKAEPTGQCSNLIAQNIAENIMLTWNDAVGTVFPDGYLIMASATNSFTPPTDGTFLTQDNDLSDGSGMVKVLAGKQFYSGWKNAKASTTYYFKAFAYTNGGNRVNYNTTNAPTAQISLVKSAPKNHVNNLITSIVNNKFLLKWNDVKRFGNALVGEYCMEYESCRSYADCGNNTLFNITGNQITLEAWVNPTRYSGGIFQKENVALDGGYRMYLNSQGELCFGLYIGGSWSEVKTTSGILPINCWSHICGTYNGTTQSIYISGVLVASKSTTGNITSSSVNLFIGRDHSTNYESYEGLIDEMAIWSTARTQPQIVSDMNLNLTGSETGLVAYYKCENNLNDATPNAINATIINNEYGTRYQTSNADSDIDGYVIQASNSNIFPALVNGTDVTNDLDLTDNVGIVKVAQGVQKDSSWINANATQTYYFRIVPYVNKGSEIIYNTAETIPMVSIKPAPTNHVTNFIASGVNGNIILNWTDATGTQLPEGYVILASTSPSITPPVNGTEVSIDNNLADGTGAIKVLPGVQSYSGWTNLTANTTYYFNIYPFTNSGVTINYKTNGTVPQANGRIVIYAEPTNHITGFSATNPGTLTLNWTDALGIPSLMANVLNFDGVNDYVTCSGSQNPSVFTAEAWFNTGILNADMAITSTLSEVAGSGFELHVGTNGKPIITMRNSSTWIDVVSPTVITANKWTHVAATYDGTTVKLYVDGQLMNSAALTAASFVKGTSPLVIGRRSSGLLYFNGSIEEVRMWNTAKSQAEVQNNMFNELTGAESGLISYYKFNQGTAGGSNAGITTLTDATTNAFNGTLSGFALTGATSNWINPGQAPSGYLIKASTTNSFTDPIDGTEIALDNDLSDGVGVIKVLRDTQIYSSFAGTKGNTTYYFKIWPYTNAGNYINYKTAATVPTATISLSKPTPITHISNLNASNNNKTITLNWTDAPKFDMGNAIALDGTNDYISVADGIIDNSISNAFTIETWIKWNPSSASDPQFICGKGIEQMEIHTAGDAGANGLRFIPVTGVYLDAYNVLPINKWTHVAVVYNASTSFAKMYINGTEVSLVKNGPGTIGTTPPNTTSEFAIGRRPPIASYYLKGSVDEFRVWNSVRSQSEIAANMYKELQGTESNLLAYYKFNQGVAFGTNTNLNTVFDATANGLNGSLMGSALSGSSSNWVVCKTDIPDGYLIKASKTNNITPPANGTVVTDDNNLSDGIGAVNVLAGVQTYSGWTNFTDITAYYYKVYPYSNSGTSRVYNTSAPVPAVKDSVGIDEFKEITTSIPSLVQGKSRWADYDNDGDMDVLIFGGNTFNYGTINNCITKFYKQNADHSFSEVLAGFVNVADGDAAWGDYNNDGLLDLIITGGSSYLSNGVISSATTKLYKQNADHTFTLQSSMPFENLLKSSVAWGDYDNDGDLDLLLTGKSLDIVVNLFVKIYRNNGNNTFTPQHQINLESIYNGSVAWGDYDKDGYLDIIMAGNSNKGLITKIYRNNKNNYFFEQTDFTLPGINFGNALWGDYDNDGDLDILINGKTSAGAITSIFKNSFPTNAFAEVVNLDIPGIYNGVAQWGDINKDGKIDILIGGTDNSTSITNITEIYFQNGDATFSRYSDMTFKTGSKGSLELVDYDNDRDLDFFITGYNTYDGTTFSTLYQNNHLLSINNQKPTAPVSLNAKSINDYTILSWDKVTTDNTPSLGLSYNLRVGTSSGTFDIASPMSDTASSSGFRRVASIGNCQQNNFKVFKLEPGKTYYWNVQAIDNSYIGGNFSEKSSFFVDSIPASGLNFLRISDTEYKVKWTRGNGNRCVVFCRADSSINNATPSMGTKYVHNSKFTYGDPIQSTDWFCVYNGLEDSVVISGLSANTAFTVQVIEYVFDASGTPKYVRKKSPKNDDWGIFNTSLHTLIPNTFIEGSIGQWADFNNDGFIDYVVTGNNKSSSREFSIGLNNGNNTFTISRPFYYYYQNVLVADFDNDGAQEIFYTARDLDETTPIVAIYDFNASPTIKYITNMQTFDYRMDYSYLCDYNKDGYIDIVRKGIKNNVSYNTIFYNNGDNTFTEGESNLDIPKTIYFEYTADYDNDGDVDNLDYLGVKQNNSIIKTGNYSANRFPSTPVNLSSQNNEGDVIIKWDAILTDETPQSLMTYDVRIRKVGDSEWYNNPLIAENGYRRTVTLGKYKTNTATLSLPLGSYEWQVQAIDQGYQSSGWSALNTFTTTSFFTADTVCLGDSTSFTDHSAMVEGQATWLWDFGDNTYSNKKNPKHKFTTPGKHVVNLSVNSYSFSDTVIVNDTLKVEFVAEDVCAGLATTIKNNTQTNSYTQWQWDFGDNTPISTNGDINSHSFPQLGKYTVTLTATDANGCSAKAIKSIVVTTTPNATLSLEYGNPSFCKGDSVIYSVPFNPNYTYNWYHNNQIITEKSNALKVKTQSGDYKVEVVNNLSNTCKAISDIKTITVKDVPAIPVIAPESNTTFCVGDSVKINAGDLSGVTYQWYRNLGQLTSNSNYIFAKESGNYTLTTSFNNGCSSKHSQPIVVTTNVNPTMPSVSYGETTVCKGNSVTFAVNTTDQSHTYQWFSNKGIINGATSNQLTTDETGDYWIQVANSYQCQTKTSPVSVIVKDIPAIPVLSALSATTFCIGDSVRLSAGSMDGVTYKWYRNQGPLAHNQNYFTAKESGNYTVVASYNNGCSSAASQPVTIVANSNPTLPSISYGETSICKGTSVNFSVNNSSNLNLQWFRNNEIIPNATTSTFSATQAGQYHLLVTNSNSCSNKTTPVEVNVTESPEKPLIEIEGGITSFCPGTDVKLLVKNFSPSVNYQWKRSGIEIDGAGNPSYIGKLSAGDYRVEAKLNQCAVESDILTLNTKPAPAKPNIFAKGPNVWIVGCSNDKASDYTWYYNNNPISGAKTHYYVANRNLGDYYVEIKEGNECSTKSDIINIPTGGIISDISSLSNESVLLFPNPTTSKFNVILGSTIKGLLDVQIINSRGSVVDKFQFNNIDTFNIDISNLPQGVYFCRIQHLENVLVKKIVKQ